MAKQTMTKSERRIRTAFIDLMEERGFYHIKVSEILERADVSRATFYANYEDKFHLVRTLRDELFDGLAKIIKQVRSGGRESFLRSDKSSVNPAFVEYFRYVKQNERLWRIFITGKGESDFSEQLSRFFYRKISETQDIWEVDPELPKEHAAVLCSWAYVALFSYWVTTGMKETPEEMAQTLAVFWHRFMSW